MNAPPRRILAPAALHGGRGRAHLLLALHRAGPGHHHHLVAANPHVADGDDGAFRLEGAAGELERLGDPHHLAHAVEHFDQRRLGALVAADGAEDHPGGPGRPVDVQPD